MGITVITLAHLAMSNWNYHALMENLGWPEVSHSAGATIDAVVVLYTQFIAKEFALLHAQT